jgi:hypothetical protein
VDDPRADESHDQHNDGSENNPKPFPDLLALFSKVGGATVEIVSARAPPQGAEWLHEIKYDDIAGVRHSPTRAIQP